MTKNQAGLCKS